MYPDQQTPITPTPPPTPMDYLNQIAPQAPKKSPFSPIRLIMIAAGVLVLVLIITFLSTLFSHSNKPSIEHLSARLQTTSSIASKAQSNIKDSSLQALNVTLQLYLSNTNRTITTPLKDDGVDTANLDKSIVSAEAGTAITAKLEDARLNAIFDNTYANEMAYQLSTTINLMQQIYNTTSNTELKTFLAQAYKNLTPIQKEFSTFNSTDS